MDPELRRVREDRQVPGRHRPDQRTQQRRLKEVAQRQRLLPRRVHRPGGHDQGLEVLQGRAGQLGLLQLRPQVSAQGGGGEERRHRVQPVPPGQRQDGLGLQPVLPRLACGGPAFEARSAGRVRVGPIPATPPSPTPRRRYHESQGPPLADPRLPGRDGSHRGDDRAGFIGGTTRPPERPATSRRTSPRTAASRGRPITATPSNTWARMRWPRSRTRRLTRCTRVHQPEDVRAYRRDGKFPDARCW